MDKMPRWADVALIPLINLALALFVSGLVVLYIGENPFRAMAIMVQGAFGTINGIGQTLFMATNLIFTGLAVAVAFHARLFNIGGEGQAVLGGIGAAIACLYIPWPHWTIALIGATAVAGAFGAAWAFIPAYLQAKRGSHIVITTIMFNYIAASLVVYLLVNIFRVPGSMEPSTARFPEVTHLPNMHAVMPWIGLPTYTPLNVAFFLAILACIFVYLLLWKTRLGYEIRAFGQSETAAVYAGINPVRITVITMLISGAMAGLFSINRVMGSTERLTLDTVEGMGFVGIAVALMGRSHPFGVFLAALLFGALYQGGAELAWEMPSVSREMIVIIQALVILFTGALDYMVRRPVEGIFLRLRKGS